MKAPIWMTILLSLGSAQFSYAQIGYTTKAGKVYWIAETPEKKIFINTCETYFPIQTERPQTSERLKTFRDASAFRAFLLNSLKKSRPTSLMWQALSTRPDAWSRALDELTSSTYKTNQDKTGAQIKSELDETGRSIRNIYAFLDADQLLDETAAPHLEKLRALQSQLIQNYKARDVFEHQTEIEKNIALAIDGFIEAIRSEDMKTYREGAPDGALSALTAAILEYVDRAPVQDLAAFSELVGKWEFGGYIGTITELSPGRFRVKSNWKNFKTDASVILDTSGRRFLSILVLGQGEFFVGLSASSESGFKLFKQVPHSSRGKTTFTYDPGEDLIRK